MHTRWLGNTLLALLAGSLLLTPDLLFGQREMWPDSPKIIQPGEFETAISDGQGGAVILLQRWVPVSEYQYITQRVVQRVDNQGTVLWRDGVIIPYQEFVCDASLVAGKRCFYVINNRRIENMNENDIQVWKLGLNGEVEWVQSITDEPHNQGATPTCPVVQNDGSIIVLFSADLGDGWSKRVQKLSPEGRRLCGNNGAAIRTDPVSREFAISRDGDIFTAECVYPAGYMAFSCFGLDGSRRWSRRVPNPPAPLDYYPNAMLTADDQGGVICAWGWQGWQEPRMQRYSRHGKPMWKRDITPMDDISGYPGIVDFHIMTGNGSFLVYGNYGSAFTIRDMYAMKYDMSGRPLWKKTATVCTYPHPFYYNSYYFRNQHDVDIVSSEQNATIFTFFDHRSWDSYYPGYGCVFGAYAVKLDSRGRWAWTQNGFNMASDPGDSRTSQRSFGAHSTRTVSDGKGGLLLFGTYYTAPHPPGSIDGIVAMQRVIPGDGPPSTPVVATEKYPASLDSLKATLQSVDNETGIAEYEFALGSSVYTRVAPDSWQSNGASSEINLSGLSLQPNGYCYILGRTKDTTGQWSTIGWSDTIRPAKRISSLDEVASLPQDWRVIPPPLILVEKQDWQWLVRETSDGPMYTLRTGNSDPYPHAYPEAGDTIQIVCTNAGADDDGRYLRLVAILSHQRADGTPVQ